MAPISLKPGPKGIVGLISVAVVIFIGCVCAYIMAAGKVGAAKKELASKQAEMTENRQIAQKLEQSKLKYADTLSQIKFLETSVSTEAYVPTLLQQLETLATSLNLKVVSVTPSKQEKKVETRSIKSGADAANGNVDAASKTKENADASAPAQPAEAKKADPPYDSLVIDVEIKGNYANVLQFLYRLNTFPKILAVKSVAINPDDKLYYSEAPMLTAHVTVTAFVLKKDEPVAPPAPQIPATNVSQSGNGRAGNEAG